MIDTGTKGLGYREVTGLGCVGRRSLGMLLLTKHSPMLCGWVPWLGDGSQHLRVLHLPLRTLSSYMHELRWSYMNQRASYKWLLQPNALLSLAFCFSFKKPNRSRVIPGVSQDHPGSCDKCLLKPHLSKAPTQGNSPHSRILLLEMGVHLSKRSSLCSTMEAGVASPGRSLVKHLPFLLLSGDGGRKSKETQGELV